MSSISQITLRIRERRLTFISHNSEHPLELDYLGSLLVFEVLPGDCQK
jgi:hypothetical protein